MAVRATNHSKYIHGGTMMFKKVIAILMVGLMIASLAACGSQTSEKSSAEATAAAQDNAETTTSETETASPSIRTNAIGTVSDTIAVDEDTLIATYAPLFEQKTYADTDSGLSITYNIYLPEGYDESQSYPMVVFIADSSCAGSDATRSLTQGRGALVWATKEWQAANPTIVVVPTYPETILDDHNGYTTTEYVELTKRFIDKMTVEYAVDTNRIYGTGQSMGCMTTLILASEYPDLYAACMFVDGQWDVSALQGLESQTFVYFAAEDDENAYNGMSEVISMFDSDSINYKKAQWDGTWSTDQLTQAAKDLFTTDTKQYFISWMTGTIDASGNMMGGAAYHMASFDYAYNCVAAMEWLFQQSK